jgi:hypothetical protein
MADAITRREILYRKEKWRRAPASVGTLFDARFLFRLAPGGFNNLQFFDRDPHTSKGTWDLKTWRC